MREKEFHACIIPELKPAGQAACQKAIPVRGHTIYRTVREESRCEAVSPGAGLSLLTLRGKSLLSWAKAAHSSGHLLPIPLAMGLQSAHLLKNVPPSHELRNEIVAELNLIRGAKVAQNRTPNPREMAETVGQRGKKAEESKN
jgi:hypothetical protein